MRAWVSTKTPILLKLMLQDSESWMQACAKACMKASCSWTSLDLDMDLNIWSINSISLPQKLGDLAPPSVMPVDPKT